MCQETADIILKIKINTKESFFLNIIYCSLVLNTWYASTLLQTKNALLKQNEIWSFVKEKWFHHLLRLWDEFSK
jgi:hypothetical protein